MKTRRLFFNILTITIQLLILSAPAVSAAGPATETDPNRLLTEASQLFHQADALSASDQSGAQDLYRKALLRYERLAASGARNGRLFYNIGNLHFRLHDLGRAILNYRRAELFMPDDNNLKQSLAYVLQLRQDKIDEQQETRVLKTVFFWHYDLSSTVRLGLGAFFYLAFWGLALIHLFRPGLIPRSLTATSLLAALLFMGSLMVEHRATTGHPGGVLTKAEIIARKGDGPAYRTSFKEPLHAGTEFRLLEKRDKWWQIMLDDGRSCWVPAIDAELVLPEPPATQG